MKARRRTAARLLATIRDEGRKPTAQEKAYLGQADAQDVRAGKAKPRLLAETGAAYLRSREAVGLTWEATGKELAQAREEQGVVVERKGKAKAKVPAFTATDIPSPSMGKGKFLAACKAFKAKFGVTVKEARAALEGATPAHVTLTLSPEVIAALKAAGVEVDPS